MNRLLVRMMREGLLLTKVFPFSIAGAKLLRKFRVNPKFQSVLREIADRDIRRQVPIAESVTVKFPLDASDRDELSRISKVLRCSLAKLVLEAIHAFLVIASAQDLLEQDQVPYLVEAYRSLMAYRGIYEMETAAGMRMEINRFIKLPATHKLFQDEVTLEPLETFLDLI